MLCRWQRRHADELRGARVLELGCGTGAVGLYAAALGARRVVLTDGGPDALLELARANAAAARDAALWRAGETAVEVVRHGWGEPAAALGSHDLILGSDVTYADGAHAALCASLAAQLQEHSPRARVVLAHEHRTVGARATAGLALSLIHI